MSAFGIFALILTTAYIIYFSVVIIRDVTSSRKSAEENSGAETFDTTFAGEQSVEVIETETGFAVGDNNVNAEPVAAIETTIPETQASEADKEAQALAIQEKLDADAQLDFSGNCKISPKHCMTLAVAPGCRTSRHKPHRLLPGRNAALTYKWETA